MSSFFFPRIPTRIATCYNSPSFSLFSSPSSIFQVVPRNFLFVSRELKPQSCSWGQTNRITEYCLEKYYLQSEAKSFPIFSSILLLLLLFLFWFFFLVEWDSMKKTLITWYSRVKVLLELEANSKDLTIINACIYLLALVSFTRCSRVR